MKTILITRHDKIGDFITALPMAKVLKEQTNCKIVFLVSHINVELAKSFDFIDEVIEYSEDSFTLLNRLSKIKADVSISGYIDMHLGLCLWLAKIPIRIAPSTKIAQIFFNKKVKQRRSEVKKTEWEYNLDLVKVYDSSLVLEFQKPLLNIEKTRENLVIFHIGFGGSSEGNLSFVDYLKLGKLVCDNTTTDMKVVYTFGPDDDEAKEFIKNNLYFDAIIKDNFPTLVDFTKYIASSKLFVSTSTGPMHLAGLTNTPTISFFGSNLFSSSKRWATISDTNLQRNFEVPLDYDEQFYEKIKKEILTIL